jgi:hypothetical protein
MEVFFAGIFIATFLTEFFMTLVLVLAGPTKTVFFDALEDIKVIFFIPTIFLELAATFLITFFALDFFTEPRDDKEEVGYNSKEVEE